jgi:hypothetical protein
MSFLSCRLRRSTCHSSDTLTADVTRVSCEAFEPPKDIPSHRAVARMS